MSYGQGSGSRDSAGISGRFARKSAAAFLFSPFVLFSCCNIENVIGSKDPSLEACSSFKRSQTALTVSSLILILRYEFSSLTLIGEIR